MKAEDGGHSHHDEHPGTIFCLLRVVHQPQNQTKIQQQDDANADETLFLGKRGQNEIRISHGHEAQLVLAAFAETFAPKSARTDGNLRLQNLIAGAARVLLGVEECFDTLLLVRLRWCRIFQPTGIMSATSTKPTAICFHSIPARNAPTMATGTSTSAVPKSGCIKIKPTGMQVSAATFTRSVSVSRSVRTSLKNRASTMIIINFINSDTWKLGPPPSETQRLAPKREWPITRTTSKVASPNI